MVNYIDARVTATPWFPLECVLGLIGAWFSNFSSCVSKIFNSDHYNYLRVVTVQSIFITEEGISIILRINTEFQRKLWGLCV